MNYPISENFSCSSINGCSEGLETSSFPSSNAIEGVSTPEEVQSGSKNAERQSV